MAVCKVLFEKNYAVLLMKNGENRVNIEFLEEFNRSLDEIERCKQAQFLITVGDGKFYSNGLDLAFLGKCSTQDAIKVTIGFANIMKRILTFPIPSIAALNGHAYAAGALLAMAHDYRVMRTNRGWFCLPEIKLKLLLGEGNIKILRAKIKDSKALTDAVLMGKRFTAEEAMSGGIVHKICSMEQLLGTAVLMGQAVVGSKGLDQEYLQLLKEALYSDVVEAMEKTLDIKEENQDAYAARFKRASKL